MSIQQRIRLLEQAKKNKDSSSTSSNNVYTTKPSGSNQQTQPLSTQQPNKFVPYNLPTLPKPDPATSVRSEPISINVNNAKKMFEQMALKKQSESSKAPPPPVLKPTISNDSSNPKSQPEPPANISQKPSFSGASSSGGSAHINSFPEQPQVIPPGRTLMTGTVQPHRAQPQADVQKKISQKEQTIKPSQLAGNKAMFAMFEDRLGKQDARKASGNTQNQQQPENIRQRAQNVIGRMFEDQQKQQINQQATDNLINRGTGLKKNKKKKVESFDNL